MEWRLVVAGIVFAFLCLNSVDAGLSPEEELEQLFQVDPSARKRRDAFDNTINHFLRHAEDELQSKLRKEGDMNEIGKSIKKKIEGKNRPFQTVQKFLKTSKDARNIGMTQNLVESFLRTLKIQFGDKLTWDSILDSVKDKALSRYYEGGPGGTGSECPYKVNKKCKKINTVDKYRTIDGSCNNLKQPLWGKAFTPFLRNLAPKYDDGISTPRNTGKNGIALPSARKVASRIHTDNQVPDDVSTFMVMTWGQYLDHDTDLTALSKFKDPDSDETVDIVCGEDGCDSSVDECFPIPVPSSDPVFSHKSCLEFIRSEGVPNRECTLGRRQQLNQITSYLDASTVYGSTDTLAENLRVKLFGIKKGKPGLLGAKLRTRPHPYDSNLKPLLPAQDGGSCVDTDNVVRCFLAGDPRANEQSSLTVTHTLWVREHNRIVDNLRQVNPGWSEETLYQETRRIVGAMHQHIDYNEYLPIVLGKSNLHKYDLKLLPQDYFKDYDEDVDGSTANVFAAAAFRFAHSMIASQVKRADKYFNTNSIRTLNMSETFFRPRHVYNVNEGGIDGFIRGLAAQETPDAGRFFSPEVSKRLFTDNPPHGLGTDLSAINIQRGRDHGLPPYNKWRSWCGLKPVRSFFELGLKLRNPWLGFSYQLLYKDVDDLDLYTVAISEPQVPGALVGETFMCLIGRQFERLRKGDRFWYEGKVKDTNYFTKGQLAELRKVTLAKVMCNNGDRITRLQKYVMRLPSKINPIVPCKLLPDIDFNEWKDKKIKSESEGKGKK